MDSASDRPLQWKSAPLESGPDARAPDAAGKDAGAPSGTNADTIPALPALSNRILIVDDDPAIHREIHQILRSNVPTLHHFITPSLYGQEALEKIRAANAAGSPFALAFVDVRMPPGGNGSETVSRILQEDPDLQVVICTACTDELWKEMIRKLGRSDNLFILKKPFDHVEVLQLTCALTLKWERNQEARLKLAQLSAMVTLRTAELKQLNEDLRREMDERSNAERQLRHAQKMEAIGQLAAGVAHDFNNVLTVIHGHASMLSMRLGEEGPYARSIAEIRLSADRAANLVRQLLMFSRKQIMQFRNVDLNDALRSVSGMLRQLVGEHIRLETDYGQQLAPIFADRGMIEQIVVNLTINARDAMAKGGRVAIRSSLVAVDERQIVSNPDARCGNFVCLTVTDTGCGIDPEALSHLFEPFFTTKEAGKGTGLGLATVYGIVKQHHGWINVHSKKDIGTTFEIFFPVSQEQAAPVPEKKDNPPGRRGTETILIAEDENSLRDVVAEVLTLRGYRVLVADSGPVALEISRQEQNHIDLLLTDMIMPGGMMGTEVAGTLKRDNPSLRVIYTTGYSPGLAAVKQHDFQEGINFLPKPYSPTQLADIVRKCLDS